MDWNWVTGSIAVLALIGHAVKWSQRHSDAERLEKMKAEIGRDVAESLKQQESRLRVEGELRLRVHDRSWQLLRELLAAAFDAREAVVDYLVVIAGRRPDGGKRGEAYARGYAAISKLMALTATAPPEHEVLAKVGGGFRRAFNAVNEMTLDDTVGPERGAKAVKIQAEVDNALVQLNLIAKDWNATLWNAPILTLDTKKVAAAKLPPEQTD